MEPALTKTTGSGVAPLKHKPLSSRVDMVAEVALAMEAGDIEKLWELLIICEQKKWERIAEKIKRYLEKERKWQK